MWLLSTWNMASATEVLTFKFNFNLNSLTWLVATTLYKADQDLYFVSCQARLQNFPGGQKLFNQVIYQRAVPWPYERDKSK